ncbi:hypothetical protein K523DRAFT_363446 [Schizophyllum commune Tattone D]|nr:hypothetical protein K523DRAFT_363446 [Schizophyllum commune Tattone D]
MSRQGNSTPPANPSQDANRDDSADGSQTDTEGSDASASDLSASDSASGHSDASTGSLKEKIDTLRQSIVYRMPIVWDTLPIKSDGEIKLFYGKPGDAHCLDLANPTEGQLYEFEAACDRATFGRNQEDVLDETYRKAGKMDTANFSTNFSPPPNFLGLVRDELLQRHDTRLVYELYKLNVYGKDAFFKPHKDTPRGPSSYGTLIVVFPAPHTGGELIFSDPKHGEWTVDAAAHVLPTNGAPNLVLRRLLRRRHARGPKGHLRPPRHPHLEHLHRRRAACRLPPTARRPRLRRRPARRALLPPRRRPPPPPRHLPRFRPPLRVPRQRAQQAAAAPPQGRRQHDLARLPGARIGRVHRLPVRHGEQQGSPVPVEQARGCLFRHDERGRLGRGRE